ncbi:uncharacterized protein si:dkey-154b15.1 [Erpetoichthys calabaricus]|uniref:uncharacterized protein si:dkey-154b15.1 n=1 Tax=Erpetoichthys calabaricus TaxID=27687 RepID=UPI0010A00EB8|nr:uncharacterized protein si:dkey-154b15.1 [Erpetoichthys calabaricus]
MAACGHTIRVLGVPRNVLSTERMKDQLTIHFLRPRNQGGEVLNVTYPADSDEEALVTFELSTVMEGVLQRPQVLELFGKTYPLKVQRPSTADAPQVDLLARTTLNLALFPDPSGVRELVTAHKFRVLQESVDSKEVHIEGSFLELKRLREKLLERLPATPSWKPSPAAVHKPRSENGAMVELPGQATGTPGISGGDICKGAIGCASDQRTDDRRRTRLRNADLLDSSSSAASSSSSTSRRSLYRSLSVDLAGRASRSADSSQHFERDVSSRSELALVIVDRLLLKFAQMFLKDKMAAIIDARCVLMTVQEAGDVSHVRLTPMVGCANLQEAKSRLSQFLHELENSLCHQKIDTSHMSMEDRRAAVGRLQNLEWQYQVWSEMEPQHILLIGTPAATQALKRAMLGEGHERIADSRQGRTSRLDRTGLRRSSSVPRNLEGSPQLVPTSMPSDRRLERVAAAEQSPYASPGGSSRGAGAEYGGSSRPWRSGIDHLVASGEHKQVQRRAHPMPAIPKVLMDYNLRARTPLTNHMEK